MNTTSPQRTAGTVLSVHRTSQGYVRYRRWPGGFSVELVDDESPAIVAVVPGAGHTRRA